MKLILSRYFLYSFIALEVLLLPKFLSQELYAQIEYQKFILYFIPFFLFGAPSGYVYFKYNQNKDYFSSLIVFGFIFGVIVSLLLSLVYDNFLLGIAGLFMTFFLIIEQKVKTEKEFFLALSIKPFISIVLLIFSYLVFIDYLDNVSLEILYYSIFIAFIVWSFFVFTRIKENFIFISKASFLEYKKLLQKGFLINVGTFLIMVFFFTDRYFTKEYYPDFLASYSFSYNLIQFIVLALTTIAYRNTVSIGEKIKTVDRYFIKKQLFFAYKVFSILFILFFIFTYILSFYYDFISLIPISLILGLFIGNFFTVSSISSIAQYKDLQLHITITMLFILCANIAISYTIVFYNINYIYLVLKTGLLLSLYSLILVLLVSKMYRY